MNILYLDFETSGLDPRLHCIVQAAWIVEREGEVIAEYSADIRPEPDDAITLAAFDVNNFTLDRLKQGRYVSNMLMALKQDCIQVASIRPCGHNVQFDLNFLMTADRRCHENLSLYLEIKKALDTLSIARYLDYRGKLCLSDYKLETLCRYFGIPIKAHDALEDVRATRAVFHELEKL